ncbi:MAG: MFS transporter [Phenylobacterium sp.]|uniref:MFS transporter n=1 Tax=Phenylobacterium sp. TaxID=1871053 RepID=UPI0025F50EC5|nr:MFS transporter [Phenylobacterium sp.]MBI1197054.1 MFS transporter [Phenylobacterium sp.]
MLSAVRSVRSLLMAIMILMAGAGFMGTLVSVRLEHARVDALLIGLVATAYFAGLTLGSLQAGRVIARVGHIRAFAAFVALLTASTLSFALRQDVALWSVLRFVNGFSVAGVYVCLESWLNERAEAADRGLVLAAYMIALYAGQAAGQFLLEFDRGSPGLPFIAGAILISLSIIPITLTGAISPTLGAFPPPSLGRLYAISPLGMVGAAVIGLIMGAFYGLGAVYAQRLGLGLSATAGFMSAVIVGGVALQWPLGWLSDRLDRRKVIVGAFAGAALVAGTMALLGAPGPLLPMLGGLFGGLSFALYPLCVAHANDHVAPEERVSATSGLVLVYSAGAAIGPLGGASALSLLGAVGLFAFIAICAVAALGFGLWRLAARPPVPSAQQGPYQALPRTTPVSAALDPLAAVEET